MRTGNIETATTGLNERSLGRLVREVGLAAVAAELRVEMSSLAPETAKAVARGAAGLFLAGYGPRATRARAFPPLVKLGARSHKAAVFRRLKRLSAADSAR